MDDTYSKLLAQPAQAPIDRAALDRIVDAQFSTTSLEDLQRARHAQEIEQHNADIDARRAREQEIKLLAKKAGITTAALKRMIGRP